jgi:hypothetical protein
MYSEEIKKNEIIKGFKAIKKVGTNKIDLVLIELIQDYSTTKIKKLDRKLISLIFQNTLQVIKTTLKSDFKKVINICCQLELESNYQKGEYHYVSFRFLLLGNDLEELNNKLMNPIKSIIIDKIGGYINIQYRHNQSHPEVLTELLPIDTLTPKPPKTKDEKVRMYYSDDLYEVAKTPLIEINPQNFDRGLISMQFN